MVSRAIFYTPTVIGEPAIKYYIMVFFRISLAYLISLPEILYTSVILYLHIQDAYRNQRFCISAAQYINPFSEHQIYVKKNLTMQI